MEFRILGALEVVHDGGQLPVPAAKQRAFLATGLLSAGRVVALPRLVDAIWGEAPPPTAPALVHTYASRLRRLLHHRPDAPIISTVAPGYRIDLDGHRLDLDEFRSEVRAGRSAAAAGDNGTAARYLRQALGRWRGPALDGLTSQPLRNQATRLDELRLAVLEERVRADLAVNPLGPLVEELTDLVAEHPLREGLRGALMLALYRLGRPAQAVICYEQGRMILREALGTDPAPHLRALHRSILLADPALDPPGPGAARPRAVPPVGRVTPVAQPVTPFQVPPRIPALVGRAAAADGLARCLRSARTAAGPVTAAIAGPPGTGKTALAQWVAHAVRDAFPDGQLYATLGGCGPDTANPGTVLAGFLRALGVPSSRLPEATAERTALLRSLLTGRRILVVLDDAGAEGDTRPLLPASPGTAVLLTGRRAPVGLDLQHTVALDALTPDDAVTLLGVLGGVDRIAAERDAAYEIVEWCGCLPLAVRIAGARLAARPEWPLAVLATRLRDEHRRLDELVAGDLAVRAGLAVSVRGLADPVRRAFGHLGVLGPAEFSPWLLAALADVPAAEAEHLVERLAETQLLEPAGVSADGQPRYRLHDLVRLFAAECAAAQLTEDERRATLSRLLARLVERVDSRPDGPEAWARRAAWLDGERDTLVRGVEAAGALGLHRPACELSTGLLRFFRHRNDFDDWRRTHTAALDAAVAAGDRTAEATVLRGLGQLRYEQDRLEEARTYFERALDLRAVEDDPSGAGLALVGIATIDREQGDYPAAVRSLRRATALYRQLDGPAGLADCAYGFSYVYRETGEFDAAQRYALDAMDAYREAGDQRGYAIAVRSMAMLHRALGELDEAARYAVEAIEIFTGVGDELLTAYGRQTLAKVRIRQGRVSAALGPLTEGLRVCRSSGDRFGTALHLRTLGELRLATGQLSLAERLLVDSHAVWSALGLPVFRARVERDLAVVYERSGDTERARRARLAALETFRRHGAREYRELTTGPARLVRSA